MLSAFGSMQAMWMMAVVALSTAPMARWLRGTPKPQATGGASGATWRFRAKLKIAVRITATRCLHAGFFLCCFHIAFLPRAGSCVDPKLGPVRLQAAGA
jgi:hypothetical protein